MNQYLARIVAQERMRDRLDEAATGRLLAQHSRKNATQSDVTVSDMLLAASRRLIVVSNRLRSAGEEQYTVQACCTA